MTADRTQRARGILGRLLTLAFLWVGSAVAAGGAAAGAPAQGSDIDIVFLVDTSKEMAESDPGNTRLQLMQAVVDLTRGRGTQRIGLVGLARTDSNNRTLLGSTTLPTSMADARGVVDRALRPAIEGVGSDGDGLVIFSGFEELASVHSGASAHTWVVLLSNGDADPIGALGQDSDVDPGVLARAQELMEEDGALSIDRDHYKRAAQERLLREAGPLLEALGDYTLTVIDVGAAPENRSGVLEALSAATSGTPVLDLEPNNIGQVAVDAIAQAPFPERASGMISRDLGGAERQTIRIYQGTRVARVLLTANHTEFGATLTGPDGTTMRTEDGARAVRGLWLENPAAGEYQLEVSNSGGPLGLAVTLEFELELSASVSPPAGGIQAVGSGLNLLFRLKDSSGAVIEDAALLRHGRLRFAWSDPDGNPAPDARTLDGGQPMDLAFDHTPVNGSEGRRSYGWDIQLELLPNGSGGFDWTMEPEVGSVEVEFSMPKLCLSMSDADGKVAFAPANCGGELSFSTDFLSGGVSQSATLALEVDLLGMSSVPVTLSYRGAGGERGASRLTIDGQPIGESTTLTFTPSTSGTIQVEVEKSGFGPYSGDVGTLGARVASGAPVEVPITLGNHLGMMTILAIVILLALLAAAFFAMKRRNAKRAWLALLDGLDDDAVLYFDDDEKGAA